MPSRTVVLWQVYCYTDPAGTDTICETRAEAEELASGMDNPCTPVKRVVTLTKAGIADALQTIPMR